MSRAVSPEKVNGRTIRVLIVGVLIVVFLLQLLTTKGAFPYFRTMGRSPYCVTCYLLRYGLVTALESKVTSVCANALPSSDAPVFSEISA